MKQKFILLSIALTIVLAISSCSNEKDSEISSTPHLRQNVDEDLNHYESLIQKIEDLNKRTIPGWDNESNTRV